MRVADKRDPFYPVRFLMFDFRSASREQIDLSASYNLQPIRDVELTLTFDAYNLTNEPLRDFFESDGNTFNIRYPGATYTVGVRGSF